MPELFDIEVPEAVESKSIGATRDSYLQALRDAAVKVNEDNPDTDIRFSTAINLNQVRNALVCIIGAGGLGNWQWRILAAMGFKRIAIYDNDYVGVENVGSQAHSIFDIGLPKVEAIKNAALEYRGMGIIARNKRVMSFKDIVEDLGEVPDIVIGCTDSADFRNNFICTIFDCRGQVPELWLDYRMSLGDWVAYIVPWRGMVRNSQEISIYDFYRLYKKVAIFPESEAVQEPCTERAIAYTGANVASFTGAVLHWWYNGGRQKCNDAEYLKAFIDGSSQDFLQKKVSFSARDFEFITETKIEKKLRRKLDELKVQKRHDDANILGAYGLGSSFKVLSYNVFMDLDINYYTGCLIIDMRTSDKYLICCDGFLLLEDPYEFTVSKYVAKVDVDYCIIAEAPSIVNCYTALAKEPLHTWFVTTDNRHVALYEDGLHTDGGGVLRFEYVNDNMDEFKDMTVAENYEKPYEIAAGDIVELDGSNYVIQAIHGNKVDAFDVSNGEHFTVRCSFFNDAKLADLSEEERDEIRHLC